MWAFGLWDASVVGWLACGWVALLGGLPVGVAVWLTTHRRKMPEDRWYRLALAFVSFLSCVAWIYYFADLAVTLIDVGFFLVLFSVVLASHRTPASAIKLARPCVSLVCF